MPLARLMTPSTGVMVSPWSGDIDAAAANAEVRRPDVMVFLPQFGSGGVERVACLLANGFCDKGLRVKFASIDTEGPARPLLSPAVEVLRLRLPRFAARLSRTVKMALALPALALAIRRERPRVLLSPGNHAHLAAALAHALAGRPRVRLAIKMTNPVIRQGRRPAEGGLLTLLYRWIFARADKVMVLSEGGVEDTARLAPRARARIAFVHNPYVAASPSPPLEAAPDGPPLILAVGRLSVQKNLGLLLDALSRLRDRPWRLAIVGTGPQQAELKSQARRLGLLDRVAFEGFVPDPTPYYRRAHVLALPSLWEDLPAVALEALACGCPVLATDCSPALNAVLERSGHGEAVPAAGYAAALAAALERPFSRAGHAVAADYGVERGVADHLSEIALVLALSETGKTPARKKEPRREGRG